jgi:flagellar hook protein FlgE
VTAGLTFGSPTQDGYAPGDLTSYAINDDGTITGTYSNQNREPKVPVFARPIAA